MKRFLCLLVLAFVGVGLAVAQTATVTRTVNLRPDPSTDNDPIEKLRRHTEVQLVEPDATDGFYHVTAPDGQDGWVWGRNISMPNIGVVALQGVAIQSSTCNTDTIIQRAQRVPPGGGPVNVDVFALFMKSTSPVTFGGQPADVYVTINNSNGLISSSVLPQPDSLAPSIGTVDVITDGTFNSSITVNADVIIVKAGTRVTNPANYLGHQPAPPVTIASTNSSWSSTAPSGYPSSPSYPSGGFYPISVSGGGHTTPTHVHGVVPARCSTSGSGH